VRCAPHHSSALSCARPHHSSALSCATPELLLTSCKLRFGIAPNHSPARPTQSLLETMEQQEASVAQLGRVDCSCPRVHSTLPCSIRPTQSLLEAMEQQEVSVAKAGLVASLPARTSIMAAANPVEGHYNKAKTIAENLKMSPAMLSRCAAAALYVFSLLLVCA